MTKELIWAGTLILGLGSFVSAHAHLLDAYLQAAEITVSPAVIELELDLTPGIQIAPAVLASVDLNHDSVLSESELRGYGIEVARSLSFQLDNAARSLSLQSVTASSTEDLRAGLGSIVLRYWVSDSESANGEHEINFQNGFDTKRGTYLANAMRSDSPLVRIGSQKRDYRQQSILIHYHVKGVQKLWWKNGVLLSSLLLGTGSVLGVLKLSTRRKSR